MRPLMTTRVAEVSCEVVFMEGIGDSGFASAESAASSFELPNTVCVRSVAQILQLGDDGTGTENSPPEFGNEINTLADNR